jgi:glycosyltransferase involved in cell wall biosynthesis
VREGWDVTVACEDTGRAEEIRAYGIKFVDLSFSRSGTNPKQELRTLLAFYKLYKKVEPDVLHHITLKPVIYGTFISKLLKTPAVLNAVSGLGYNFTGTRRGPVQKTMIQLMRYGFKRKNLAFIFQNKDDLAELRDMRVIQPKNKIHFIKGSGVDLTKFINTGFTVGERVKILLPTRMLWDKGVAELRAASEILKNEYHNKISFILAGLADEDNKAGVPSSYLTDWEDGEYVKWLGYKKEMAPIYNDSDIVVLPSYREGMPKTLIEACAAGRPIVTTDAIGCRECVDENVNGFKVPVKSTLELAEAIKKLVDNETLRISMGKASRKKAEREFDQKEVLKKHLLIYEELLNA